jgi:hypothetical protein
MQTPTGIINSHQAIQDEHTFGSGQVEVDMGLIKKYESVDDLFGLIFGIERTLLVDKHEDTLLNIIEKVALIPEAKLVLVEPLHIPWKPQSNRLSDRSEQVKTVPKVKGVVALIDVLTKLLNDQ